MYVSKHIDWLSVTFPAGTPMGSILPLADWHYIGRGLHGYQCAYKDSTTGALLQEAGRMEGMGIHLQLGGEALHSIRSSNGGTDGPILTSCASWNGRASRIDLAFNIHEGELTPRDFKTAVEKGSAHARSNTWRYIEGKKGDIAGDTFYIGSPTSDRQLRVYNKAAELGIQDNLAWLRLELELRRLRANAAFESAHRNGVEATITGHMADFLAWSNREYEICLSGLSHLPAEIPRRDSNRRRWLLGQVVQALAKEILADERFPELFAVAVKEELARIKK